MARTYETESGNQERIRPLFNGGSQAAAAGATAPPPGAPAPGTPGALPAAANVAAVPGEGIYQQQQALAQKAYQDAIANLQANRSGIYRQNGFLDNGQVDPNNTLGLYQQDRNAYAHDLEDASESAHGRGLGGSGLGAQISEAPRYQHEVQSAELMRQYLAALSDNTGQQTGAANTLQASLLSARQQQIQDAISNGDFTPAGSDSSPDDSSPAAPPATTGTRTTASAKAPAKKSSGTLDAQRAQLARSLALNAKYGLGKKTTTYNGRH